MYVCGYNEFNQLYEESNGRGAKESHIINPPKKSHLNVSMMLSFSTYQCHSVYISTKGEAYTIGNNSEGKVWGTLDKKIIKKETKIEFIDKNGDPYNFISAVCGFDYTLYLVSTLHNKQINELILCYKKKAPLILNIGNLNPQYLFGGISVSAAIDSHDGILVMTPSEVSYSNKQIQPYFLPNCDKPIKIACCNDSIIALSSNGKIYELKQKQFIEINIFNGSKIVDISGSYNHFILLCENFKVYGRGTNEHYRLGMPNENTKLDTFTELTSLTDYKITSVFAGAGHSLFITNEGKIIGCGTNGCGELMLPNEKYQKKVNQPSIAHIDNPITFCIAGNAISVIFSDVNIPPNMPNQIIRDKRFVPISEYEETKQMHTKLQNEHKLLMEKYINLQENLLNEQKEKESLNKKVIKYQAKIEELNIQLKKETKEQENQFKVFTDDEMNEYEIVSRIGNGSTAEVFDVTKKIHFALKQFYTTNFLENEDPEICCKRQKRFILEYEVVNRIHHPNIIKTYGIFFGNSERLPSILFEYCPYTLKKRLPEITDNNKKTSIIIEVAHAMKQIHSAGIIHRDLKLENILLDKDDNAKVSDFGICTLIDLDQTEKSRTQMTGTVKYMAPELLRECKDYDSKVDVYAFGIVVFMILNEGKFPTFTIEDVLNGKSVPIPENFTKFSSELIQKCLSAKASDRPSFDEICESIVMNKKNIIK